MRLTEKEITQIGKTLFTLDAVVIDNTFFVNFADCLTRKTTIVVDTMWEVCITMLAQSCHWNGPTNIRAVMPITTAK